ncbi:hypothetical protein IWX49DRAFT_500704 [Phyllosticta citricarpa]|uniref:Zn(2)-C6 fungal-type domain-containing protein n=2 Tax=Phyllosticta TaxID=121621 RepID=A0ABR1MIV8_9PEZI
MYPQHQQPQGLPQQQPHQPPPPPPPHHHQQPPPPPHLHQPVPPNGPQQPHWPHPSQPSPHQPNGAYPPPPPPQSHPLPPPTDPRPDMTSLQQQQPYRLPAPHSMYPGHPAPPDPYRPPPHMYQQHQPAPRQRTAIACRYCRRRKIRCSGFEASEDGRCTNCVRFSQECIFTPVSAQTQAFVPAHTVWRGAGQPPPLYGAYGQPLPSTQPPPDSYRSPHPQPGYPLPNPGAGPSPYSASGPPPGYPPPPAAPGYDDRGRDSAGRKRPTTEPHTPTLPPPNPAAASQLTAHRPPEYTYPDPTNLTPAAASPASSTASYPPGAPPQQPYYAPQPPRRSSPQSTYSYDPSRASSSPHTQGAPSTPGGSAYTYTSDSTLRPPTTMPLRNDGRTPPPMSATSATSTGSSRAGMRISDMVSGNDNTRSATDADMLNALNRRGM